MILRRIAASITNQNWFQVIIEIFIVVIGIFLGLQVTDWAEDRAEREQERNYLIRLHTDADQLITLAEGYTERTENIRSSMMELTSMLLENQDSSEFTKSHCNSLAFSHIYVTRIVALPTLNELLSSGQILLIRNERIRELISNFTLLNETTIMLLNSLHSDKLDMGRKYPNIVKLQSPTAGDEASFGNIAMECNFDQMLANQEFINDLISNNSRYNANVIAITSQLNALRELHDALAEELGITHEEQTP